MRSRLGACFSVVVVAAGACACERDARPDVPAPAPVPVVAVAGCGEPSAHATELPDALATGPALVGDVDVEPDQTVTIGGVELKHELHGILPRPGTHSGHVLTILIPRAEVGEHAPWGGRVELFADLVEHREIGPYGFDVSLATESAPVHVVLRRSSCPRQVIVDGASTAPTSVWLSTEGIRAFVFDPYGDRLSVSLSGLAHTSQVRLDVDADGYGQVLHLSPGREASAEPPGRRVVVERVVAPAGCAAAGEAWRCVARGRLVTPRAHTRLRIEPRARAAPEVRAEPTPGCGEPHAGAIRAAPALVARRPACPRTTTASLAPGRHAFWLGTDAHQQIVLELPGAPHPFSVDWWMHDGAGTVSLSLERSHASIPVRPAAVGRAFTLDGIAWKVAAIVPSDGTTWSTDRWESVDPIPRVLIGFEVTVPAR